MLCQLLITSSKNNPEEPMYLAERGNCALETGYPHEALQYYEKAMALFSESPDMHTGLCIYAGMCSAYIELGMKREAMVVALEGLKRFPDDEELKKFLSDIEDDMDDPDKGDNLPFLRLILIMAILQKRLRNK
jgi:tetratricopeptide (TPR) repeat protein